MRCDIGNGLPCGDRQGSSGLALLAIFALALPASASASAEPVGRGYEGPSQIGEEPVPVAPTEPGGDAETPDGGAPEGGAPEGVEVPAPEGDGDDGGFAVEDESGSSEAEVPAEEEGDEEECDDGFCIEDLTEDEEALAKELEVPKVEVKGPTGTVRGRILDSTDGTPLIGAKVTAVGTKYATKSDFDGNYERERFQDFLDHGFVDTFRHLHPDATGVYSWWNLMSKARERNVGWRIDYFLVSEALKPHVVDAGVHMGVMGSDHCPVSIELSDV